EGALGYYDFLALINTYNNMFMGYVQGSGENPWPGSIAPGLENRDLKWETTDTKNIGLDYGFLDNRLYGSLNYYYNKTNDLLITKVLPPSAGLYDPILNVGKIKNSGVEIEVNWNDKIRDFQYNVGFNLTTINNKVLELASPDQVLYGEGLKYGSEHFPTQTRVGKTIGGFYLYKTDGIFQSMDEVNAHVNKDGDLIQPNAKPGDIRFADINGDVEINEDDKEYCGAGIPKVEANLSLGASYKGFDFSVVFGSAWGHKIYNGNRYFYEGMASGSNFLKSSLNAWTPENTNTDIPRAVLQDKNGNARESDRFLENGNFLRMRQLQFGYTLPSQLTKKAWIESLRVYVSGENLWTWSNYSGIDPEFSRASVLNSGIDNLIYPFNRTYVVGLQVVF
ncbi:MAG: TonB-dependent receptor domain-containing protein, partial [Bacteroidales bacterium]